MTYCATCGARTDEGAYCGNCGAVLPAQRPVAAPAAPTTVSPYPSEPVAQRASRALPIGLTLIAIGLAVLGTWWFLAGRASDPAKAAATAASSTATTTTPTATPVGGSTATPIRPVAPTAAQSVVPTAVQTVVPTAVQTITAAPLPTVTADGPGAAPAPGGAGAPAGSWILVLDSLEQSRFSAATAQARAAAIPGTVVVDSSQTPGLNAGYWAIVGRGYYPSKRAASSDCASFGRTASGSCYPRQVG